jgi:hypothetical protein
MCPKGMRFSRKKTKRKDRFFVKKKDEKSPGRPRPARKHFSFTKKNINKIFLQKCREARFLQINPNPDASSA